MDLMRSRWIKDLNGIAGVGHYGSNYFLIAPISLVQCLRISSILRRTASASARDLRRSLRQNLRKRCWLKRRGTRIAELGRHHHSSIDAKNNRNCLRQPTLFH